jgi:SAM-dependent methyltransferase
MTKGREMYHPIEWTPERIERFWDFYSANAAAQGNYFSKQYGRAILSLVRGRVHLAGPLVDLGCGPGYFLEELLRNGFACKGIDSSAEAVASVQARLLGRPGFLGAAVGRLDRIPLEDGEAGTVCLIEVMEHLAPDLAEATYAEIHRALRPGGHLIITVPNAENLEANSVACPECGCVFHRMQHLQRFTAESLAQHMTAAGFKVAFSRGVALKHFTGGRPARVIGVVRQMARRLQGRPSPNLVAVASRGAA